MQERRKDHRDRTYLGGRVAFNDRNSTMDCLIRNMSRDGAKLVFSSTAVIPGEFDVFIQQKGESRRARVTWRGDQQAGIAFLPSENGAIVSIETAQRMKKLESACDGLARRVAQLSEPA